jgi:hypothetical protein
MRLNLPPFFEQFFLEVRANRYLHDINDDDDLIVSDKEMFRFLTSGGQLLFWRTYGQIKIQASSGMVDPEI